MGIEQFHITAEALLADSYSDLYYKSREAIGWDFISKKLNEQNFTVKHAEVSSRVIHHWAAKGILYGMENYNDQEWKKFSLSNLIWLFIIKEARDFGLSLEKLLNTYQSIFKHNVKDSSQTFNLFIAHCLRKNPPEITIVIFSDGHGYIVHNKALELLEIMADGHFSFIKININSICSRLLDSHAYSLKKDISPYLERVEEEIIDTLRSEDWDEISLVSNAQTYDLITKKTSAGHKKISDMVFETNYGEVTAKIENGKVVSTNAMKRRRIKK